MTHARGLGVVGAVVAVVAVDTGLDELKLDLRYVVEDAILLLPSLVVFVPACA